MYADMYSIINGRKEFFVIGGENIYGLFLRIINKVFLTEVDCGKINGDAKFDVDFSSNDWWQAPNPTCHLASERDQYPFTVSCYIRRVQQLRIRAQQEFIENNPHLQKFIGPYEFSDEDLYSLKGQLDLFIGESGMDLWNADSENEKPELQMSSDPFQLSLFG